MLERIEPDPLLVGNVFGDNVPQLLNERQVSVFGVKIAEEEKTGEIGLLWERCDDSARHALQIWFECPCQRQFPLQSKFRLERQPFESCENRVERRRPRVPETGGLLIRELHEFLP